MVRWATALLVLLRDRTLRRRGTTRVAIAAVEAVGAVGDPGPVARSRVR